MSDAVETKRYVLLSELLPDLEENEAWWFKVQLDTVYVYGDGPNAEVTTEKREAEPVWTGPRFLLDSEYRHRTTKYETPFVAEIGYNDTAGNYIWFRACDDAPLEPLGILLQKYIRKFAPAGWLSVRYAVLNPANAGGGVMFISYADIKIVDFVDEVKRIAQDMRLKQSLKHAETVND